MANKRITELVQITAPELTVEDLLLLADISAQESKKLRLDDLATFIFTTTNLTLSGSLYGTASWAENVAYAPEAGHALEADHAVNSDFSNYTTLAGYANSADDCNYASFASDSSHATQADYSYQADTASFVNNAVQSQTSSFLYFNPLVSNGTASNAATASVALTAILAATASSLNVTASQAYTASFALYALNGSSGIVSSSLSALSASFASSSAQSQRATQSISSSFLVYNGLPNGTASYAVTAGTYPNFRVNYGTYQAHTQSATTAQLDSFDLAAIDNNDAYSSSFQAWGTLYVAGDDSTTTTGSIELIAINRWSGITASIDASPIDLVLPVSGAGAMVYPFSLAGDATLLTGPYSLYVTCSGNIKPLLVSSRNVRFNISSLGSVSNVTSAESMSFQVINGNNEHPDFYYTSSGAAYSGSDSQVAYSGSSVTEINISDMNITNVKYAWTLKGLKKIDASLNAFLTDIGGMPESIVSMSVNSCIIREIPPLQYTSASYLNFRVNAVSEFPTLPSTMSYIDCGYNVNLLSLPSTLPYGIKTFIADNNPFVTISTTFPDTIVSMSINNCTSLVNFSSVLPSSLAYFKCYNTQLTSLPSIPSTMKYLYMNDSLFTSGDIDTITTQLVTYGLTNGYLDISGNIASYSATTLANISTLSSRSWTVVS